MVTALAHGVAAIKPFAKLDDCLAMKAEGYYTAGERNGEKVDGFDFGNSPFEYMDPKLKGERIAFTTTNGTQAIARSEGAKEIIIGSFLNLTSVTRYLKEGSDNVLVVCAAWKGKVNLEDTLFAGALVELMKESIEPDCDAPLAAQRLYNLARYDMVDFLKDSSHVKRLNRLNIHKDILFCLTPDQYDVVPRLINGSLII
jgi:2-phosphosulfolactate phosphatase